MLSKWPAPDALVLAELAGRLTEGLIVFQQGGQQLRNAVAEFGDGWEFRQQRATSSMPSCCKSVPDSRRGVDGGAVRSISVWACRYIILEIIAQNARFTRKFHAYLFTFAVFPPTVFFAGFAAVAVFFAADVAAPAATREPALTTGNFTSSAAARP
jgi:hypothetical protein